MPFKSLLTWPPKPYVIWASHSLHLALFLSLSDNILTKLFCLLNAKLLHASYLCTTPFPLPGMFFPQPSILHLAKFLHVLQDSVNS